MIGTHLRGHVIITLERFANVFALTGILTVLLMASVLQFVLHELPCPLCLLQRIGFFCMALGFLLNIRVGFHPRHYSMVLMGSLFTALVALRQVALHIVPGSGAYGDAFLGLHLYTWAFVLCMTMMGVTAILLGFKRQYKPVIYVSTSWRVCGHIMLACTIALLLINIGSTFLECGFSACPESPTTYHW